MWRHQPTRNQWVVKKKIYLLFFFFCYDSFDFYFVNWLWGDGSDPTDLISPSPLGLRSERVCPCGNLVFRRHAGRCPGATGLRQSHITFSAAGLSPFVQTLSQSFVKNIWGVRACSSLVSHLVFLTWEPINSITASDFLKIVCKL